MEAVLLIKFHYCQPTNRLLNQYKELGLPISPGTIAGNLKKLKELFQPVYEALYNHQMTIVAPLGFGAAAWQTARQLPNDWKKKYNIRPVKHYWGQTPLSVINPTPKSLLWI